MLIKEPSHDGVSLVGKAGDCNSPERKLIACSSQAFITISDRVAVAVIEEKEVISMLVLLLVLLLVFGVGGGSYYGGAYGGGISFTGLLLLLIVLHLLGVV